MSDKSKLPIGSTIGENIVYHSGNHDKRGNPHNQYVAKNTQISTLNTGSSPAGNYSKLYNISYLRDNNYRHQYDIVLIDNKTYEIGKLKLVLSSTGVDSVRYDYNSNYEVVVTYQDKGIGPDDSNHSVGSVNIYVKSSITWLSVKSYVVNAILYKPRPGSTVFTLDTNYPFECITEFNDSDWSSLSLGSGESQVAVVRDYPATIYASNTSGTIDISAGSSLRVSVSSTSLLWNSVVSMTLSATLPGGLVTSLPQIDTANSKVSIVVTNVTSGTLSFPSCTITAAIMNRSR